MIPLCIFDLDGTSVDTLDSLWYTGNRCLAALGLTPQPRENYCHYAGDGSVKLVQRFLIDGGDVQCSRFSEAFALYRKLFEDGCTYGVKPFDGVPDVMKAMKLEGAQISIFSNKDHDNTCKVMEASYPPGFFLHVLGYSGAFPRKPSPLGALYLAEQAKADPTRCLYVGDTNTDMATGKAAGMYTVGVTWGFRSPEELIEAGADAVAHSPEELLAIFRQRNRILEKE